jgi:hypothetical protein
LKYEICELWGKDVVDFSLGDRMFQIRVDSLKIKREQFLVLENQGIPIANEKDIFSIVENSDIYAHIEICMDNI